MIETISTIGLRQRQNQWSEQLKGTQVGHVICGVNLKGVIAYRFFERCILVVGEADLLGALWLRAEEAW